MLLCFSLALLLATCTPPADHPAPGVTDPGVRGGDPGAGGPLPGLTADETTFFDEGKTRFFEIDMVTGGDDFGLGPRFNSNQCASCHSQPALGGTTPAVNPLLTVAKAEGTRNIVPWFIIPDGPLREARFKKNPDGTADGGVHALFTIAGRTDAVGCTIAQPDFLPAGDPRTGKGGNSNIVFRIPTPVFGAGLIEAIPDAAILANMKHASTGNKELGIQGRPNANIAGSANLSGNDGTITRFGWKAQNKSLLIFSGEAHNVEMGVTNELSPQERDETDGCVLNATPEDVTHLSATTAVEAMSDIEAFSLFMRFLAPPAPAPETPSTAKGKTLFVSAGCAACHTPSLMTGPMIASGSSTVPSAALSGKRADLYSDLLLHHMGEGLADGITQGSAGPDEFRTAPLWGVGQRLFFLHDGRTSNLIEAIEAHRSSGSEANKVVERFNRLSSQEQQDIINFLRSL
jgi:CxxC motif-containing protein (DUF1111 family)